MVSLTTRVERTEFHCNSVAWQRPVLSMRGKRAATNLRQAATASLGIRLRRPGPRTLSPNPDTEEIRIRTVVCFLLSNQLLVRKLESRLSTEKRVQRSHSLPKVMRWNFRYSGSG